MGTNPLVREKTVTQISGDYGSGKTHLDCCLLYPSVKVGILMIGLEH